VIFSARTLDLRLFAAGLFFVIYIFSVFEHRLRFGIFFLVRPILMYSLPRDDLDAATYFLDRDLQSISLEFLRGLSPRDFARRGCFL